MLSGHNQTYGISTNAGSLHSSPSGISKSVELDTRIEMASWSFAQKDFDTTVQYAEHVLNEVPGDPRALALIAACQILIGNLDAGIVQLNQAINGAAIERYEEAAEEAYEHLSFCDDDTVEIAWSGFNECIQFLSQPDFSCEEDDSAWEIALKRARACVALERGDFSEAIIALKDHLRQFPDDVEARFELARAYFSAEDNRIASELLMQVLDQKPSHAFAASLLARVHAAESDFVEAIRYATHAFELNPQSCRTRLELIEYLYDNHDYREALDVMADAPKCDCGWFKILHARTQCYCQLERFESAMETCQEMLDCEATEVGPEIDFLLGQKVAMAHYVLLIAKVDGLDCAMLRLEQESEMLIADKWFALETAALYHSYQEFELAARLIECLSYENLDDPDVMLASAIAESEVGRFGNEKSLLKHLIITVPDQTIAYLRLSSAYEREGQLKEALFWALRAANNGDSQGRVEYQAARLYCLLQSFEISRQFLDAAIAENSSFRGRAKADDTLAPLNLSF